MKIAISITVAILLLITGFIWCREYDMKDKAGSQKEMTSIKNKQLEKEIFQKKRDIIAAITMI